MEKLHNLYSGGAVVPLPVLRAADAAPLALLGMESGGAPHAFGSEGEPSWQESLAEVVAESVGGLPPAGAPDALPAAVLQRVHGSPVLLNLAKSLAHHKWALERQLQQQQDGAHVPPRVREQLHQRAADLTDTLRTILCL